MASSSSTSMLEMSASLDSVELSYSIAGWSEHSGQYIPENIKVDRPFDQSSRWSSSKDNNINQKSWILLKLDRTAVLESIVFGKFQRQHPCNMKDFEIHVGMSQDHLTEVLRSSLKNDSKPEAFTIPHTSKEGIPFPTQFVKIVSVSAHAPNFNTSIWFVGLTGIADERYVRHVTDEYDERREAVAMRHILKHLRQRRHISTYRQLQSRTGVQLEHPLVSELYEALVLRGDWETVECQLHTLASDGLFSAFIHSCTPHARWKQIRGTDANGDVPSARGGHAMCMDVENGLIYLFGGYDGRKSLDDFWVYNVREDRWKVISHNVVDEKNGPGPRACHKMVYDPKNACIYMLGRLGDGDFPSGENTSVPSEPNEGNNEAELDPGQPGQEHIQDVPHVTFRNRRSVTPRAPPSPRPSISPTQDYFSEFYRYRTRGIDQGKWELLNVDTALVGGPKLIYDHQLVLDSEAQVLYVQGGRVVDGDWRTAKYSGLYGYDLRTGKWTMLQAISTSETVIPPRFGHSMVFEPNQKKLFIFAGQKDETYLSDMWEYDVQSRGMTELFTNFSTSGGPDPCFSQRAVIDPALKEIYVLAGLTKTRNTGRALTGSTVSLYRYNTNPGTWTRVPAAKVEGDNDTGSTNSVDEPVARSAHQVVYDPRAGTFYMHGGNAGFRTESPDSTNLETRLDDFWSMTLERPAPEEIVRQTMFMIRQQQFKEMCEDCPPVKALAFLQNDVSSVVNHVSQEETMIFRSLLSHLLARPAFPSVSENVNESIGSSSGMSTPTSHDSEGEDVGTWTSELPGAVEGSGDGDAVMLDATLEANDIDSSIRLPDDPYELHVRAGKHLSEPRFKQRTEVFEKLLVFLEADVKQPTGSLLDSLRDYAF